MVELVRGRELQAGERPRQSPEWGAWLRCSRISEGVTDGAVGLEERCSALVPIMWSLLGARWEHGEVWAEWGT